MNDHIAELEEITMLYNLPVVTSSILVEQQALDISIKAMFKIFNSFYENKHNPFLSESLGFKVGAIIDIITEQVLTETLMRLDEDVDDLYNATDIFDHISNNIDHITHLVRYLVQSFYLQVYSDCEHKLKMARELGLTVSGLEFYRPFENPQTVLVKCYLETTNTIVTRGYLENVRGHGG